MRNLFGELLAEYIAKDENIWLLTGDLGFGILNKARQAAPDRAYNVGAAEQLMLGAAVGLAHNKKIPICYSITPFVIFRPYEWLRNYLDHEQTPVKLAGAGRDKEYGHLGFSHWAVDDERALSVFSNIKIYKPANKQELTDIWDEYLYNDKPSYLNLSKL
jgi:transketolase